MFTRMLSCQYKNDLFLTLPILLLLGQTKRRNDIIGNGIAYIFDLKGTEYSRWYISRVSDL